MKYLRVVAIFLMLLLVTACAGEAPPPDGAPADAEPSGIVSVGPSNTEILVGLGLGGRIVAADDYSRGIEGLGEDILYFDMITPDVERLLALGPDLMLVSGMTSSQGTDPYKPVSDAGVPVVYIASSESLDGIMADILEIAGVVGRQEQGDALVAEMRRQLDEVAEAAAAIPAAQRARVYVEIAAAPDLYSFGSGVYLDEILTLVGCENILAGERAWVSVSDEIVLAADPDVILTTVDYLPDPVGEICARPGWDALSAVQAGRVYRIDTDSSNRPSHNVVKVLREIAELVYPEHFVR